MHGVATGDSTVNLANKDCEVPFQCYFVGLLRQTARQQGIKRNFIFFTF